MHYSVVHNHFAKGYLDNFRLGTDISQQYIGENNE